MKITFIQFSNKLINSETIIYNREYFDKVIKKYGSSGFIYHDDFFEIPKWVAILMFNIKNIIKRNDLFFRLVIINEDNIETINFDNDDYVFASIGDYNLEYFETLLSISKPACKVIVGGYTNKYIPGVIRVNSIHEAISLMAKDNNVEYREVLEVGDYSLFRYLGKTIPRITLMKGCPYKCSFCDVPKVVTEVDIQDAMLDFINYTKYLDFSLVYIDDKNFKTGYIKKDIKLDYLRRLKDVSFIVQTRVTDITSDFLLFCKRHNIRYIEVGVEIYDDEVLKYYNKGITKRDIDNMINKVTKFGEETGYKIKIIPNFIIDLPNATSKSYKDTLYFIKENKIDLANIFLYSDFNKLSETSFKNRDDEVKNYYFLYFNTLMSNF